ncbi:hypothetical protein GCM10020254_76010 [Streptomyces goshikiensis]
MTAASARSDPVGPASTVWSGGVEVGEVEVGEPLGGHHRGQFGGSDAGDGQHAAGHRAPGDQPGPGERQPQSGGEVDAPGVAQRGQFAHAVADEVVGVRPVERGEPGEDEEGRLDPGQVPLGAAGFGGEYGAQRVAEDLLGLRGGSGVAVEQVGAAVTAQRPCPGKASAVSTGLSLPRHALVVDEVVDPGADDR